MKWQSKKVAINYYKIKCIIYLRLTPSSQDVSSAFVFAVILPASSILAPLITSLRFLPSLTTWILQRNFFKYNIKEPNITTGMYQKLYSLNCLKIYLPSCTNWRLSYNNRVYNVFYILNIYLLPSGMISTPSLNHLTSASSSSTSSLNSTLSSSTTFLPSSLLVNLWGNSAIYKWCRTLWPGLYFYCHIVYLIRSPV